VRVTVCDVGPRDGLQNEPELLAPDVRGELVRRLAATGLPRIEAVSFVSAERVPQMAGAEEVVAAAGAVDAELSGLVLNERGWERLAATTLDRVNVTFAATESFNRRNGNASLAEAIERVERILAAATIPATTTISCSFGCPFEGEVDPGVVFRLAERLVAAGAGEIVVADTIGVATPGRVRGLVERCATLGIPVGGHFHDTRHTGVACAWAALEGGAAVLDASVGGVGGCPFAPRATGNVATEDVLYLLHREGVETGVDLDGLIAVAEWLQGRLGRELPGRVYRAGGFGPTRLSSAG
jgi:hydroxymethylglutaryl-CoA lyase/(R)-citramalyl-CoA lyase